MLCIYIVDFLCMVHENSHILVNFYSLFKTFFTSEIRKKKLNSDESFSMSIIKYQEFCIVLTHDDVCSKYLQKFCDSQNKPHF